MINLTKHHGLGNDFLVCDTSQVDGDAPWPQLARRWCDRRTGIGADGLLLLTFVGSDELSMVLFNADGSRAEMSGNGVRCLAQAAYMAQDRHGAVEYTVHTDAGARLVTTVRIDDRTVRASVSMGEVTGIEAPHGWAEIGTDPVRPVLHLSVGNPHTVVGVDDVGVVDLVGLGTLIPQVNLEIVEPGPQSDAITMRVHERGAGITQACGTGACASAWAAAAWGLATPRDGEILVHMDGGDATVRLHEPMHGHVTLIGPAVFVGYVQVDR
jgi:diaminopimelate epimerase